MILWLRSLAFNVAFWLTTAAVAVFGLPVLAFGRFVAMRVVRVYARVVLIELRWLGGIEVRVTGAERLPRGGAALIAAKHQSAFDTVVWLALLPNACYVLKHELLRIPVWGWWATGTGQIAVDRSAGLSAMRHLLKAGKAAAEGDQQLVIFPEGTRTAPGDRVPYQPGIVALASATGLPVIPVATNSGLHWARRAFLKRPGTITIAVLPPLPAGLPKSELLARLELEIEAETTRLGG
jgi:1-acyl-sn-glycerol-3-phosphate acyltransferase